MARHGLSLRVKQYPNAWRRLKPPSTPQISWVQNTLLFPLSPHGTFTLCGYIWGRCVCVGGEWGQKAEAEEPG